APAAAPLTAAEYRARLLAVRILALSALREPRSLGTAAARRRIETTLPLRAQVRMPSGEIIAVDNQALATPLSQALGDNHTAARRTGLLRFVASVERILMATAPPPPALDRVPADTALRGVLKRPEFQT